MEKNFRLSYLTKVGFVGVDLEKAIDQLLNAAVIDRCRLVELCQTHELPAAYRLITWKLMLGVLPCHQESVAFVLHERREHFDLLLKGLHTMRFTDRLYGCATTDVPASVLSMAYVVERKLRPLGIPDDSDPFLMVHKVISLLSSDSFDRYWLTRNICFLFERPSRQISVILQEGEQYLTKNEPALCKSVLSDSLSAMQAVKFCMQSSFYGLFQPEVLFKLWDKVIAGSLYLPLFVLIECLRWMYRLEVQSVGNEQQLVDFIKSGDQSSLVDRAVDLWLHNGKQLESRVSAMSPFQLHLRRKKSTDETTAAA